jgi:hypothetical protein
MFPHVRRNRIRIVAVASAVALLVAWSAVAATAGASTRHKPGRKGPVTKATVYEPFKRNGRPAFRVGDTFAGTCSGPSKVTNRDDAWRCLSYDPCFSSAKARGYVLCPINPWDSSVIKIKYSGRLPRAHRQKPSISGSPWAIETTTLMQCVYVAPPTYTSGTLRATYFCSGNMPWLWGRPSRRAKLWTIYSANAPAQRVTRHAQILRAWF